MSLKDEILKLLPKDAPEKIRNIFAKYADTPPAPTTTPAATPATAPTGDQPQVPLADGTVLLFSGDIAPGVQVLILSPDGTSAPAADGTYTGPDGDTYTVAGGLLTAMTPAPIAAPTAATGDMAAMMSEIKKTKDLYTALSAQFSELKKENEALKTAVKSHGEDLKVSFSALNSIVSVPVSDPTKSAIVEGHWNKSLESFRKAKQQ